MYVVTVTFRIRAANRESFMTAMREQASTSLEREPGCHLFDICCDPVDPCRVFLYEHYTNRSAFTTHLASDHFGEFDRQVAAWVLEKQVETWYLDGSRG